MIVVSYRTFSCFGNQLFPYEIKTFTQNGLNALGLWTTLLLAFLWKDLKASFATFGELHDVCKVHAIKFILLFLILPGSEFYFGIMRATYKYLAPSVEGILVWIGNLVTSLYFWFQVEKLRKHIVVAKTTLKSRKSTDELSEDEEDDAMLSFARNLGYWLRIYSLLVFLQTAALMFLIPTSSKYK